MVAHTEPEKAEGVRLEAGAEAFCESLMSSDARRAAGRRYKPHPS